MQHLKPKPIVALSKGLFYCRYDAIDVEWHRECTSLAAASIIAFVANEIVLGDSVEKAKRYVDAKCNLSEQELEVTCKST